MKIPPASKVCIRCKTEKPSSDFGYEPRMADGVKQPCRKCEYQDQKRRQTPEQKAANTVFKKEWKKRNPEKVKADNRRQQQKNRSKVNENSKRWRQKNKSVMAAHKKKRRAIKLRAAPVWSNDFFVQEAYDLARRRTKATGIAWDVDHIVPLRSKLVCGLHAHTNVQVIPKTENLSKRNFYWPDMP